VVIIGDPQQLAPIVQAKTNEAKEWLGRDLFTMRGITLSSTNADSVMLNEQARMHPRIADIVRQHVYKGRLNHSPRVMNIERFQSYSAVQPLPGKPILLCDTGDAFPIATAPGGKSRINAYHALCSIELARQALSTLPERPVKKGEFRIGLITPYRKQAQLLQQLVKDAGLTDVVRAGTVHRFQGLEAEVIIFDTVESTGLLPSTLTAGSWGSAAMRLTNVAMTRAQYKLIIVANYQYLQQKLGKYDTLRLAAQDAYAAGNIQSSKFLHFASQHNVSQPSKGNVRSVVDTSSLSNHIYEPEFLDEGTFFQRLEQDISLAKKQVVIFSPFIERDRTEKLIPLLAEKTKAGITITVICRSGNTSASRQTAEKLLKGAGVQLRQPNDMKHEKFVFIDDEIAYMGSLNPLSQIKSTEFMERVKSPGYVHQLKKFKQVDDVVKAPTIWGPSITASHDELPNTTTTCTKCGGVLIRKKNYETQQPFYGCPAYRKSDPDHSTENVSEHHLRLIPRLEEMKCGECGKSTSIRVGYKEIQIVCVEEFTCGYRQRVEFISDGSV
jgi:AAA domain/PLD-like domain